MKQQSRKEFEEYCLRRLGKPLIDINVSAEQVDDRIDDALDLFKDRHFDSMEETYLIKRITFEDYENGYITLPDIIIGVVHVFPISNSVGGGDADMFNILYQMNLNDYLTKQGIYSTSGGLANFYIYQSNRSLISWMMIPEERFEFNKKTNKLVIYHSLSEFYNNDRPIVIKCYMTIGEHKNIWSDPWLRDYATQLIKRQWSENIKKFGSITLPSGMTLNGDTMYSEAIADIQRLEDQLLSNYELPHDFFMG